MLMFPPKELLSSAPWIWRAALVIAFYTETPFQWHPGKMEQPSAGMLKPRALKVHSCLWGTKQLGSFMRTILPPFAHLLDHKGRRVCSAIQGSSSVHWDGRRRVMKELCCGVLLPPGYPLPWGLCFITRRGGGGGRKVTVHEGQE